MKREQMVLGVLQFLSILLASCSSGAAPLATVRPGPASASLVPGGKLTVLAAASLTSAFKEIGTAFEASHPAIHVTFNFAGSQELRTQIEQGAKADVFASADTHNMDVLKSEHLLADDPQVFAHNSLVVITPAANPAGLKDLKDLARPGIKLIVADSSVPVGGYTIQFLDRVSTDPAYGANFKVQVLARVVSKETDVQAVVSKVSLGEGDAGVVYTTDAKVAADKLATITIPDRYNVIATCPLAALKGSANSAWAQQFIDYVLSFQGQAILSKFGFAPR